MNHSRTVVLPPIHDEIGSEVVTTGLFCMAEERTESSYEYVGEGRGGYSQKQIYSFVGEGAGEFERTEVKSFVNLRPRACTVAIAVAALLAIAALVTVNLRQSSGRVVAGGGCGPWDCMCGVAEGWDDVKKTWCCQNRGQGCPPDNSVVPLPGVGKLVSALQGCATSCEYKGVEADCAARVRFSSEHRFAQDPNKCQAAYDLVKSQCAFCEVCPASGTGCLGLAR